MSIAFDAAGALQSNVGTSLSYLFTCTGSNGGLLVGVAATSDLITGVTYNGVSMTLVRKQALSGDAAGWAELYLYDLPGPATGSNSVVVSASGSVSIDSRAVSYTGLKQTSQIDASNSTTASAATSITPSVTVVGIGCWTVAWFRNDQGNFSAGSGTTMRGTASSFEFGDSNAVVGSGSNSLQGTWTGSGNAGAIIASIAPVTSAGGNMFAVF